MVNLLTLITNPTPTESYLNCSHLDYADTLNLNVHVTILECHCYCGADTFIFRYFVVSVSVIAESLLETCSYTSVKLYSICYLAVNRVCQCSACAQQSTCYVWILIWLAFVNSRYSNAQG